MNPPFVLFILQFLFYTLYTSICKKEPFLKTCIETASEFAKNSVFVKIDLLDAMNEDVAVFEKSRSLLREYHLSDLAERVINILCQQAIFGTEYDTIIDREMREYLHLTRYKMN